MNASVDVTASTLTIAVVVFCGALIGVVVKHHRSGSGPRSGLRTALYLLRYDAAL